MHLKYGRISSTGTSQVRAHPKYGHIPSTGASAGGHTHVIRLQTAGRARRDARTHITALTHACVE
jgi:hypothetical protein